MLRTIRIFNSQVRNLTPSEIFRLLMNALFKSKRILVYVKELDNKINPQRCDELGKYIFKGQLDELKHFRSNMLSTSWEFYCDLYDGVNDFFIFKKNGVIGHISWIYYRQNPNRIIKLADYEAEIKYCLTVPKYRGRRLYPATLVKIQRYLKDKGYKRVFICVNLDNNASIRGIQKAEFEPIAKIKLIKFMGFQLNRKYSTDIAEE